jgi:hypothetical protein
MSIRIAANRIDIWISFGGLLTLTRVKSWF